MSSMPTTSPLQPPASKGLAVALGSSFFGFYSHTAFMRALHDQGIFPSHMSGTSAGAVAAALCGVGLQGADLEAFVMQRGLRRAFLDWAAPLRFPGVVSTLVCSGILSGHNFVQFLRKHLPKQRLEECTHPRVQLAVTNLTRRECVLVEEGDIAQWVMASCAVPGLFCNQVIDGMRWCDGGVALEIPFDHWLEDPEIHTIVLHRIEHVRGTECVPRWPSVATGFAASHDTINGALHQMRMRQARESGKRVIEVVTETPHPGLLPSKVRSLLLETGYQSGTKAVTRLLEGAGKPAVSTDAVPAAVHNPILSQIRHACRGGEEQMLPGFSTATVAGR